MTNVITALKNKIDHSKKLRAERLFNAALGRVAQQDSPVEVTLANNEGDIAKVAELDLYYGPETIDFNGLVSWWKRYPRGIYVLWKDGEIIGAIGIWPITKAAYDLIVAGKRKDYELSVSDIRPATPKSPCKYWYLGDIIIDAKHRSKPEGGHLTYLMIDQTIRLWRAAGDFTNTIQFCAIAVTIAGQVPHGAKVLRDFKFSSINGVNSVFCRNLPNAQGDLDKELDRLVEKIRWIKERKPHWFDQKRTTAPQKLTGKHAKHPSGADAAPKTAWHGTLHWTFFVCLILALILIILPITSIAVVYRDLLCGFFLLTAISLLLFQVFNTAWLAKHSIKQNLYISLIILTLALSWLSIDRNTHRRELVIIPLAIGFIPTLISFIEK